MDLQLTTPNGASMEPAAVSPDTTGFAQLQDRMRSEATGEATAEVPAPPKRDETTAPAAPKRTRARKESQARTTSEPPKDGPKAEVDYGPAAQALIGNVWLGAAMIPVTQPYAAVLSASSDGVAGALAEGAKHNETIRGWLTSGTESTWKLQLAGVAVTMGMQCWQIARDPELRDQAREVTRAQLAEALRAKGIDVPAAEAEAATAAA